MIQRPDPVEKAVIVILALCALAMLLLSLYFNFLEQQHLIAAFLITGAVFLAGFSLLFSGRKGLGWLAIIGGILLMLAILLLSFRA